MSILNKAILIIATLIILSISLYARYYDSTLERWISVDPAIENYLPNPNDFDTEHDYFWYLTNDKSQKLPGIGGVFNAVNLDMYHYAGQNPVKLIDPNGKDIKNSSNHVIAVIPEDSSQKAVLLVPGKTYKGKIDGVVLQNGTVYKISGYDSKLFPTINVTIDSEGNLKFDSKFDKLLNDFSDVVKRLFTERSDLSGKYNRNGNEGPGTMWYEKATREKGDPLNWDKTFKNK
jgi:hypothetical protein